MAERGIGHRRFDQRVVDAVEFEREEQKMRRRRGQPLLHVAVEFGARRIDGVAGMQEPGIGAEPAHQIVDRLIAAHRFGERRAGLRRARQLGELALVGLLEGDAVGVGAIEIALDRRIVQAGIEVGEIPLGQRPERGFCGRRAVSWPVVSRLSLFDIVLIAWKFANASNGRPHRPFMWRSTKALARPRRIAAPAAGDRTWRTCSSRSRAGISIRPKSRSAGACSSGSAIPSYSPRPTAGRARPTT